jgi:hypothetical protein
MQALQARGAISSCHTGLEEQVRVLIQHNKLRQALNTSSGTCWRTQCRSPSLRWSAHRAAAGGRPPTYITV